MRQIIPIEHLNKETFFDWFGTLEKNTTSCILNSNDSEINFELLIGIDSISEITIKNNDSFESLKAYQQNSKDWLFGFLTYDLKNELEATESKKNDKLDFPPIYFFRPKYLFRLKNSIWELLIEEEFTEKEEALALIDKIKITINSKKKIIHYPIIKSRFTKNQYIKSVKKLKQHIQKGNIYEVNFCQEFFSENAIINPFEVYKNLNSISPAPFSCYFSNDNKYLMCSSPERFLKKSGQTIISQPIKGTIKRGKNEQEDESLKRELYQNPKERSENVMIVDLVRNDLSKTAQKNSVNVDELFGIYTFKQVHQMISTVSCKLKQDINFIEAVKNSFPMGSMTGAPKLRAMQLIEEAESTKRGLFSGAVGYISPDEDFDFNVVIRSILYNEDKEYLSFSVGSAITINCHPEKEYEECLLKARAMFESLK